MIKGSERKYQKHQWSEPVSKVDAAITCFPKVPVKRIVEPEIDIVALLGKRNAEPAKLPVGLKGPSDVTILEAIIHADYNVLFVRWLEERCMNCGCERSRASANFCNRCYGKINLQVKRSMSRYSWRLIIGDRMRSKEQLKINDRRKKDAGIKN